MTHLVLLSGWGCDARIWQPLADHWPAGVSVTTPDWPGVGGRPALEAPASLAAMAEAMAADLPEEAVWVGWSLGGLLAGALLERLPAPLSPPRGLILLGMGARFCDPAGVSRAELAAFRRAFARDPDATLAHFHRWQLGGEPRPRDAYRQLRTLLGEGPPPDPATLAAGLDWLVSLDISAAMAGADCPVIRLAGARDPLLAPAAIEGADHVLEHAGHCPMLSRPAALAKALVALAARAHQPQATGAEEACS
ncbi:alpha/beta fold hydrolase [Halomonas sp. HK25]|uniref:alpha/beta fold hydrolase n=1 Tax=Halomonas sp. HK25 TaxID=3394321 RepID=UPI0039FC7359